MGKKSGKKGDFWEIKKGKGKLGKEEKFQGKGEGGESP